jgi:L-amino acid N-acyltransferase YncA
VLLAEDAGKELIGMFFSVEDYWNPREKTLVVKSVARHPADTWRGLGRVIGNMLCQNAVRQGYQRIIHAFLREQGTSTAISQSYTEQILRRYVLHGCRV